MDQSYIRNFAIIAHIDHGKSTLADRLLEFTGTISPREMVNQLLDSNPIERERGITIKLAPVRMMYRASNIEHRISDDASRTKENNQISPVHHLTPRAYTLNLIDTPGHVDFSYEVSRSLAACEGAILVVDATQGVQAQTLANLQQARKHNLVIIPVINKIDLPNARISETIAELLDLGFRKEEMIQISAKTGQNVALVFRAIVERIPPPSGNRDRPLRALVFSSQYDPHKGVVVFVRVVDGKIDGSSPEYSLRFMTSGAEVSPIEIGYFTPKMTPGIALSTGEVGYIATGLKDIRYAKVGDTVTTVDRSQQTAVLVPLPGYQEPKSMVFLALFPVSSDEFQMAREAMEKLRLSDSAFSFRPISSLALGNGFHCGFLGLLHAEVVQERLLREFSLTMIATAPSVEYHIVKKDGEELVIQSPAEFPDPSVIESVKEPIMDLTIFAPRRYVGAIMQLCQEKRGEYIDLQYLTQGQALKSESADAGASDLAKFTYLMPLSEMIVDFFDRLKSATEGYASLDYQFFDYHEVDVVKLDILVNKEKVDAFSTLVVRERARDWGKHLVGKLAEAIPRQQFEVPIQAAIGGQIVARADVKAFRKDVIAKLYGGDRTRKDKLLDKQKKGKVRMKMIGKVEIPQSAFFAVLKREQ